MKFTLSILSLLLLTTGFSQSISTEAPSVSASAVTVPKGYLQSELSLGIAINNDFSTERNAHFPFLLARYGLGERFELRAQTQFNWALDSPFSSYSWETLGIGAKYALLPNDGQTNLALIANFSPMVQGWQARQGDLILAFSHSFKEKHSIGANGGYSLNHSTVGDGHILHTAALSFVYSIQFAERWTVFGEGFMTNTSGRVLNPSFIPPGNSDGILKIDASGTLGVDFGLQFLLRDNIQLDFASGFSLLNHEHFHSLGFNIYINTRRPK